MELVRGTGRLTWQLRFTDHTGVRRQVSTYNESRGVALTYSRKIEALIEYRLRGDKLPGELQQWLHILFPAIRKKLLDWGIVEARNADGGRPLFNDPRPTPLPADWKDPPESLVDQWEQELADREVTANYSEQSAQRVRVLLALEVPSCKPIRYLPDLTAEGVIARVRELRRIGPPPAPPRPGCHGRTRKKLTPQTCEHYLAKAREFGAWLVARGYLGSNPLAGTTAYSPEVIREHKSRDRRALTLEEQATLLTGTPDLPHRWNMDGSERALLYRVALRTGLRAQEIRTLKVWSFNLFTRTLTLLAADTKASREDTLPIAAELVELLRNHFTSKLPQASVFTPLPHKRYCRMMQDDLKDLGIAYRDHLGKYADFHALRHTFCTELAKVTMPAVHQQLTRHADIQTTMKFYTHVKEQDKADALAKLPALPEIQNTATGAG